MAHILFILTTIGSNLIIRGSALMKRKNSDFVFLRSESKYDTVSVSTSGGETGLVNVLGSCSEIRIENKRRLAHVPTVRIFQTSITLDLHTYDWAFIGKSDVLRVQNIIRFSTA